MPDAISDKDLKKDWLRQIGALVAVAVDASTVVPDPGWAAARAKAAGQLRRLASAIAATQEPAGEPLIVMLRAILKNLTVAPRRRAEVVELERYLREDDIIADAESPNPFGVHVALRAPLLRALQALKETLPD